METVDADVAIIGAGGAAGVIKSDDSLEHHFNDTVGGGDWLSDQDAVDYFIREAMTLACARTSW